MTRENLIRGTLAAVAFLLGATAQEAQWNLREELRLGGPGGGPETVEEDLSFVLVGEDGGTFIPQGCELRVFDPTGNYLRTIGRCGEGPGEFRRISRAGFVDGDLWIADAPALRVTLYAGDEGDVETVRLDHLALLTSETVRPQAVLADGTILVSLVPRPAPGTQPMERLVRVSRAAAIIDTLATIRGGSGPMLVRAGERTFTFPFAGGELPAALWFVSPDGRRLVIAGGGEERGQMVLNVEVMEPSGHRVFRREVRREISPAERREQRRLSDATREALLQQLTHAGVGRGDARRAVDAALPSMTQYRPLRYVRMDADHRIWLALATSDRDVDQYLILEGGQGLTVGEAILSRDPRRVFMDGRPGRDLPESFPTRISSRRIGGASGQQVWMLETDQDAIPYAVRYRIEAGARSGW